MPYARLFLSSRICNVLFKNGVYKCYASCSGDSNSNLLCYVRVAPGSTGRQPVRRAEDKSDTRTKTAVLRRSPKRNKFRPKARKQ